MEPGARSGSDVALRAIFEALSPSGNAVAVWRRFAATLTLASGPDGLVPRDALEEAIASIRAGLTPGQLLVAAEQLGVLEGRGNRLGFFPAAAEEVARALELAGTSLTRTPPAETWVPVGTIPELLRREVVVPNLRQTAGVLLDIVDHARRHVWITAPFVERLGLEFLTGAIVAALGRGVSVALITRPGSLAAGHLSTLVERVEAEALRGLRIFEVSTEASDLGSHAKVCLADDEVCYLGSANLTAYGLGRHLELGARLHGSNVAVIRAALDAIVGLAEIVYPDQD